MAGHLGLAWVVFLLRIAQLRQQQIQQAAGFCMWKAEHSNIGGQVAQLRLSPMRSLILLTITLLSFGRVSSAANGTLPPVNNRLLIIGDSLTSGLYATSENNTFARLVADKTGMQLARRYSKNLEMATATWSEVRGWRPSVVVLEIGLNDVSGGKVNADWATDYEKLVRDMVGSGATVIACTVFYGGIQPSHPNYAIYQRVNAGIARVAVVSGARLADLWTATNGCVECVSVPNQDSYFAPHYHGDGFHPSDHGHRVIANVIADAITGNIYYLPFVAKGN